jgi:hypothetical protein
MSVHRIHNRSCSIEKIKQITLTTGLAIGGIVASGSVMPAGAFSLFFGEDVNADRNINNIPNSKAAETAFLSKLTGYQTEGFEGITTGFSQTTALTNATITTNLVTSGVSDILINPMTGLPTGRFPIGSSSTKYYEVGSAGSNTTTTITFNNSIAAFGFYATDIENLEGIQIQLNDSANTLLTWTRTATTPVSGSAMYYGIVAQNLGETFTSATFSLSPVTPDKQQDRFGLDNLSFATFAQLKASATAVPEPFTVIGTLIGGTAAFRMRKRLKSNK